MIIIYIMRLAISIDIYMHLDSHIGRRKEVGWTDLDGVASMARAFKDSLTGRAERRQHEVLLDI